MLHSEKKLRPNKASEKTSCQNELGALHCERNRDKFIFTLGMAKILVIKGTQKNN